MGKLIQPTVAAVDSSLRKPISLQPDQLKFKCIARLAEGENAGDLCLAQAKTIVFVRDDVDGSERPYSLCGLHDEVDSVEVDE